MDSPSPTALRLEELATLAVSGEAVAAEMELSDWCRQGDAPAAARVLLAALRCRRLDLQVARDALGEVLLTDINRYDPRLVQMLVNLLLAQGLAAQ